MDMTLDLDVRFRRYFVLFRQARFQMWWSIFTPSNLAHCSIVEAVHYPDGGYLCVDYFIHTETCFGLTNQEVHWEAPETAIAKRLVDRDITAVAVIGVEKKYRRGYIPFGAFTCVSIVKSILGVHRWKIQTPKQLLKYLEREGATILWAD